MTECEELEVLRAENARLRAQVCAAMHYAMPIPLAEGLLDAMHRAGVDCESCDVGRSVLRYKARLESVRDALVWYADPDTYKVDFEHGMPILESRAADRAQYALLSIDNDAIAYGGYMPRMYNGKRMRFKITVHKATRCIGSAWKYGKVWVYTPVVD